MFAIHKHIYKGELKKRGRSRLKWLRLSLFSQNPKLWFGLVGLSFKLKMSSLPRSHYVMLHGLKYIFGHGLECKL